MKAVGPTVHLADYGRDIHTHRHTHTFTHSLALRTITMVLPVLIYRRRASVWEAVSLFNRHLPICTYSKFDLEICTYFKLISTYL